MTNFRTWIGAALVAVSLTGTALAGPPTIAPGEIRPGMTGYGLSVFQGAAVDTFGVTVIGVQPNVRVGGSMILIEVSGHGLELSSIAQGMSGSPVFIEGRLAGALAFGWGGALKPIAGVTPIDEMFAVPTDAAPAPADLGAMPSWSQLAPGDGGARDLAAALFPDAAPVAAPVPAVTLPAGWPEPAAVAEALFAPPAAGGTLPAAWICRPAGAAAAGGTGADAAPALVPGGACAVPLVLGDALLGAVGTVTWVQDGRVWMFGHPFMQRGPVDLPLAGAEILTTFPSRDMSFKMGTIGKVVGTVHRDQRAGLLAVLGEEPPLVPIAVRVTGPDGERPYAFQVADDPLLLPALVFWASYNALLAKGDDASLQTVRVHLQTRWDAPGALGRDGLAIDGVVDGPGGAAQLAPQLMAPLQILLNNPYRHVALRGGRRLGGDFAGAGHRRHRGSERAGGTARHRRPGDLHRRTGAAARGAGAPPGHPGRAGRTGRRALPGGGGQCGRALRPGDPAGGRPVRAGQPGGHRAPAAQRALAGHPDGGPVRPRPRRGGGGAGAGRPARQRGAHHAAGGRARAAHPGRHRGAERRAHPLDPRRPRAAGRPRGPRTPTPDRGETPMTVQRLTRILILATAAAVLAGGASAGPLYWDWPQGEPFAGVVLDGAALDAAGHLQAGLGARRLGAAGPDVFWCLVPDGKGGFYTGTGHGGEIHHVDAKGQDALVASLDAAEVFSLLLRPDGSLLAGCGPEGELMRIDRDGGVSEVGRVPGGYVWALLAGDDGTVWAATGSPGALWRLEKDGSLAAAVDLPAQNVLDLAWDDEGRLLAATQGPGLVYRLDPHNPDHPQLLFEADQGEVRQFLRGPGGDLFVLGLQVGEEESGSGRARAAAAAAAQTNGANGGGNLGGLIALRDLQADTGPARAALYRLGADGVVTPYWSGDTDLMIAAWSERWGWVGGGVRGEDDVRAVLHRLTPPAGMQPVAGWDGGDVMAVMPDPQRERLVLGEAHPGALTALSEAPGFPRTALSQPVDAGRSVRWGRLRWEGTGDGPAPAWSVRTGNRSEPDADWSAWSDPVRDRDTAIAAPPGRFLQWRVEFPDGKAAGTWRVTSVSVSAWRDNLPPAVTAFALQQVTGIMAGGLMPRGDNVTQTLTGGLRVEYSRNSEADPRPDERRAAATRAVRNFSWQAADPDGDRLTYDLEYRSPGEDAWRPILMGTQERVAAWNTAELPDGAYQVRLTASDEDDNPAGQAAATSRTLGPVVVDNTPPTIGRLTVERTAGGVRVRFRAEDKGGVLAGADLVLPDGTRERLDPTDRICDSAREDFDREVAWPRDGEAAPAGPWPLRVEVRDLGGNLGFADGEAR